MLYTPERLRIIGAEATKIDSVFSLADRIGLLHDSYALAEAGYLEISGVLTLYRLLREEKESKRDLLLSTVRSQLIKGLYRYGVESCCG